jgi:hypothetical protein
VDGVIPPRPGFSGYLRASSLEIAGAGGDSRPFASVVVRAGTNNWIRRLGTGIHPRRVDEADYPDFGDDPVTPPNAWSAPVRIPYHLGFPQNHEVEAPAIDCSAGEFGAWMVRHQLLAAPSPNDADFRRYVLAPHIRSVADARRFLRGLGDCARAIPGNAAWDNLDVILRSLSTNRRVCCGCHEMGSFKKRSRDPFFDSVTPAVRAPDGRVATGPIHAVAWAELGQGMGAEEFAELVQAGTDGFVDDDSGEFLDRREANWNVNHDNRPLDAIDVTSARDFDRAIASLDYDEVANAAFEITSERPYGESLRDDLPDFTDDSQSIEPPHPGEPPWDDRFEGYYNSEDIMEDVEFCGPGTEDWSASVVTVAVDYENITPPGWGNTRRLRPHPLGILDIQGALEWDGDLEAGYREIQVTQKFADALWAHIDDVYYKEPFDIDDDD